MLTATTLVLGGLVAMLGIAPSLWVLIPALFVIGLVVIPNNSSVTTLTQQHASADIIGRASAALGTVITAAGLLSMALAGILGDAIGILTVIFIGGVLTVLAGLASIWLLSERRLGNIVSA